MSELLQAGKQSKASSKYETGSGGSSTTTPSNCVDRLALDDPSLAKFAHVVLVGSEQDGYVPLSSAFMGLGPQHWCVLCMQWRAAALLELREVTLCMSAATAAACVGVVRMPLGMLAEQRGAGRACQP